MNIILFVRVRFIYIEIQINLTGKQNENLYHFCVVLQGYGIGDICREDFDGDTVVNAQDSCPENAEFAVADFKKFQPINLDPKEESQIDPVWKVFNDVNI